MGALADAWSVLTGKNRVVKARGDGWTSYSTGYGTAYQDRAAAAYFRGEPITHQVHLIRELLRSNALARRVVWQQVTQAWGAGLDWQTNGDAEAFKRERTRLRIRARIQEGRAWGRAFGGGLVWVAVADGKHPSEPLTLPVGRVLFLRALDRHDLAGVEINRNAQERDGEPEYYRLTNPTGGLLKIHHTRILRFEGERSDMHTRQLLDGWSDSVLQPVYESLRAIDMGGESLSSQLQGAVQTIYKIKGLHEALLSGDRGYVEDWIRNMEMFRGAYGAIGLDADEEDISYLSRPLKDSVEVYYALMHRVASAAGMPMTELFGMAPGGLSTDDQSGRRRWYDKIEAEERQGEQGEALDRLLEIIASQTHSPNPGFGTRLSYTWPALEKPTPQEAAGVALDRAELHARYIGLGVYTIDDIPDEDLPVPEGTPRPELDDGDTAGLSPVDKIQQGRLALDMVHSPATSEWASGILGLPTPTPEEIAAYWELKNSQEGEA